MAESAKPEKKGFFSEFKEFITRGNVLDMAIGVIIATAFGKITTTLVNEVLMPFIGWLFGGFDLSKLNITLEPAVKEIVDGVETVTKEAVVIGIGSFIAAIIDFIIIAFIVFLIVKGFNKAHAKANAKKLAAEEEARKKAEEEAAAAAAEPTEDQKLLAEIRDLLKERK